MKKAMREREMEYPGAFWNERVKRLTPYSPGEQPRKDGVIKLNTNENPYPPSPAVFEAIRAAADGRLRLYPDPRCAALRAAIADRYDVEPEQVFTGNGSDEVLAFVFGAFFEVGLPALFPDVTYSFYPVYANLWGVPFKEIPLNEDFSMDTDGFAAAAFRCGGAIFPNPNAPTGIALPVSVIAPLAKKLAQANKVLVVDEAYHGFGARSAVPLINENPGLLTVHTLSKSASLAGLRAGFAIGQRHLIEALESLRDSFNSYTMDTLAQAAALAAIKDIRYYEEINQKVIKTRERTAAELATLGFTSLPSNANFIFTKPPPPVTAARLFSLLREDGILTRYFNKPRTADYIRVSIGREEDMDRFLDVCRSVTRREEPRKPAPPV
jgi:histidinol-phosphate aminotransferase